MDFKIVLTLNETNRTDRGPITREIDGSLFQVNAMDYAITDADREALIQVWIDERGEDQHGSPLELISYIVEKY
jgi:hypothetical protein